MATRERTPAAGDIVWLSFDPHAGREQAGRRPALILSPVNYNRRSGLAIVCPITSRLKGYPFEVKLPTGLPIGGVALCDQLKSLDWQARRAEFACRLPAEAVAEILAKALTLLR